MIFKLNLFPFSRHRTPPPPLPPTFRATVWRIGHSRVRVLLTRVYGTVRVDYTVIYIDNMYFYVVIDFFRGDYYCIIVWWGGSRDGGSTWWLWYIYKSSSVRFTYEQNASGWLERQNFRVATFSVSKSTFRA